MGLFGKSKQVPPKDMASMKEEPATRRLKGRCQLLTTFSRKPCVARVWIRRAHLVIVREWTSKIRKEGYQLERQIHRIKAEEEKVKRSLKDAAKKGDKAVCLILAKEILHSRKAVGRLHTAKANLNSVQMQMNEQLANLRLAGSLQASTDVMRSMQSLIKVPEVARTMREMSEEMMKAGIIQEMMDDAMESALGDDEETENEAQEEVEKVLWELTAGQLGAAPSAVTDTLPAAEVRAPRVAAADDDEEDLDEMRHRLEALRST